MTERVHVEASLRNPDGMPDFDLEQIERVLKSGPLARRDVLMLENQPSYSQT